MRGSSTIHKGGGASMRALRGPAIQLLVRAALDHAAMVGVLQLETRVKSAWLQRLKLK